MKRVEFAVYNVPGKKEETSCARLISRGTRKMEEVCEHLNESCSINSSDIKAVLDALSNYIGNQLSRGYSVELEGLGYFSPALKTKQKETTEEGKVTYSVTVDSVNFRCAPELREKVKDCKPKKVKRENDRQTSFEERKVFMLEYLRNHPFLNISDYTAFNRCTYYIAQNDIKKLVEEGCLEQEGYKTHRVYKLTEKGRKEMEETPSPAVPLPERIRTGYLKI